VSSVDGEQPISEAVQRLIERHIGSLGELEVLLLTRRTSERAWAADDVGRELRTSSTAASTRLAELVQKGLLRKTTEGYRYAARGSLDAAVGELEQAYARYRTRIVSMIFQ
jgi:hypothetical protein